MTGRDAMTDEERTKVAEDYTHHIERVEGEASDRVRVTGFLARSVESKPQHWTNIATYCPWSAP